MNYSVRFDQDTITVFRVPQSQRAYLVPYILVRFLKAEAIALNKNSIPQSDSLIRKDLSLSPSLFFSTVDTPQATFPRLGKRQCT